MPPVLTSGEEKDIVEASIGGVAIIEGLEGSIISSSMQDNIAWASSLSVLITGNDNSDFVGDQEVVALFVSNAVELNQKFWRSVL